MSLLRKIILFLFLVILIGIIIGCNKVPDSQLSSPQRETINVEKNIEVTSKQEEPEPNKFNEILEKYYDYIRNNNQIVVLLGNNKDGFTDNQLAAYAIMSFDNYDYEKGNSKEEFDAITEKYFGRKIKNFNNGSSEVIPETNKIRATGWSFDSNVFMVLKSLIDEADGSKTAEFYTLNISDSAFSEFTSLTEENIKNDLLKGDFSKYSTPYPSFITRMRFEEIIDETGKMYLKYLEINQVDESIDQIIPYGSNN